MPAPTADRRRYARLLVVRAQTGACSAALAGSIQARLTVWSPAKRVTGQAGIVVYVTCTTRDVPIAIDGYAETTQQGPCPALYITVLVVI